MRGHVYEISIWRRLSSNICTVFAQYLCVFVDRFYWESPNEVRLSLIHVQAKTGHLIEKVYFLHHRVLHITRRIRTPTTPCEHELYLLSLNLPGRGLLRVGGDLDSELHRFLERVPGPLIYWLHRLDINIGDDQSVCVKLEVVLYLVEV